MLAARKHYDETPRSFEVGGCDVIVVFPVSVASLTPGHLSVGLNPKLSSLLADRKGIVVEFFK